MATIFTFLYIKIVQYTILKHTKMVRSKVAFQKVKMFFKNILRIIPLQSIVVIIKRSPKDIVLFQLLITIPAWTKSLQIFSDISKTQPPFEMKCSHVSFIVHIHLHL